MALLELPTELILLIAASLSESDVAHLLQVHRSLYEILLLYLYQRHVRDDKGLKGLFWCTATGNEAPVKHFLRYGADVNACTTHHLIRYQNIPFKPWFRYQTPLNIAANTGNDKLITLLLSHGANVHAVPVSQESRHTTQPAVVDALLSGHESTVQTLLSHGSPIHGPNMEQGGLVSCAVSKGQVSLLKLLVEFGADLNIPRYGIYPLNTAVKSSDISAEIVQFLLDNGAKINIANGDTGRLLGDVISSGTIDVLGLLLDSGATGPPSTFRFRVSRCSVEAVRLLRYHGFVPDIETLMNVVRARRADILQFFIDSGVCLNMRDTAGATLLHRAVYHCGRKSDPTRGGRIAHVHVCRRHGPLPDLVRKIEPVPQQVSARCTTSENFDKYTPEEMVRCLIRGGADVRALDMLGRTPLALALAYDCPLVVQQMLVDAGGIYVVERQKYWDPEKILHVPLL